jgi:hypothetical protein
MRYTGVMNRTALKSLAATAAAIALVLGAAPAHAAQTKRVVTDPVEPGKAYDIVKLVAKSQKTKTTSARVTVTHGRDVKVGDTVEMWLDIDADKDPDIHVVADSFSEYSVFQTTSFLEDGKDISNRGCASLKMDGKKSVLRFDPKCLKAGATFRVSVQSSRSDRAPSSSDFAPAAGKFTKRVVSGPLA